MMTKVELCLLEMEIQDFLNTERDEFSKKMLEDFKKEFKEKNPELEDYIDVCVETRLHIFYKIDK